MLPSEVKNARILCFNYKSNWAPTTNVTKIRTKNLGEELMRVICQERSDVGARFASELVFVLKEADHSS